MISNKHGPPGWLHPPNKGAPRGPSPGKEAHQIDMMTGCFNRNGRSMPEEKVNADRSKFKSAQSDVMILGLL